MIRIRRAQALVVAVLTLAATGLATIAVSAPPAGAVSTFTVTSAADSGAGTLRKAIDDASAADADSVIDVTAGLAITLTGFAPVYAPGSGDKTLTINGNGASVTRTAGDSEIFRFNTTGDVTINALDVTNLPNPSPANGGAGGAIYAQGSLFVRSSTIHGTIDATGNLGYRGGALYAANVDLVDSAVTGSTTSTAPLNNTYGGAIYANTNFTATNSTVDGSIEANSTFGSGGAVYAQSSVVLDRSRVTGSLTSTYTTSDGNWFGGAVSASNGTVTLRSSQVSGTVVSGYDSLGGGIYASEGASLTDSSVLDSVARTDNDKATEAVGGGIYVFAGDVTLVRSTVGRSAATSIGETGLGAGGGIYVLFDGTVHLTNSTVAANTATATAGGVSAGGGVQAPSVVLSYASVSGNSAHIGANLNGPLSLPLSAQDGEKPTNPLQSFGSVVANPAGGGTNCDGFDPETSAGYNLADDTSCGFSLATDRQGAGLDPLLGALADNGGPAPTLLPQSTSPLVDAIPAAACQTAPLATGITTDERGLPRPGDTGPACDIGAVELQAAPPVVIQPTFTG